MTDISRSAMPLVPVSWGEVIDKITILEIKAERIADAAALANVARELAALNDVVAVQLGMTAGLNELRGQLRAINCALWEIEDAIREQERIGDYGPEFIRLARAVYATNDERARLKRAINDATGSALVEEKSYVEWRAE